MSLLSSAKELLCEILVARKSPRCFDAHWSYSLTDPTQTSSALQTNAAFSAKDVGYSCKSELTVDNTSVNAGTMTNDVANMRCIKDFKDLQITLKWERG